VDDLSELVMGEIEKSGRAVTGVKGGGGVANLWERGLGTSVRQDHRNQGWFEQCARCGSQLRGRSCGRKVLGKPRDHLVFGR